MNPILELNGTAQVNPNLQPPIERPKVAQIFMRPELVSRLSQLPKLRRSRFGALCCHCLSGSTEFGSCFGLFIAIENQAHCCVLKSLRLCQLFAQLFHLCCQTCERLEDGLYVLHHTFVQLFHWCCQTCDRLVNVSYVFIQLSQICIQHTFHGIHCFPVDLTHLPVGIPCLSIRIPRLSIRIPHLP